LGIGARIIITIIIIIITTITGFGVADDNNSMIETCWAAIVGTDYATAVVLELATTSVDSNGQWGGLQRVLDAVNAI